MRALGNVAHAQTKHQVLAHTLMWVESVVLKDHGDIAILWRKRSDVVLAEEHAAAGRSFQTGDDAQDGTLPAARRSDQDN